MKGSRELFSEVLELELYDFDEGGHISKYNDTDYALCGKDDEVRINIYELMHKCKEWAVKKGYHIYSAEGTTVALAEAYVLRIWDVERLKTCWEEDEPNAVFEACEYIRTKI